MPTKPKRSPQDGFVRPVVLVLVRLLTAVAIALACYLLWISLTGSSVAGCGPDSSCDRVLHSRWSRWLGLPVSAIALLVYLGIFSGTFWLRRTVPAAQQRKAWRILIPCAVALMGAAIWFVIVQAFILRSFCPFCMVAHGCGLAAAAMLLSSAPFRDAPEKPWQQEKQVFVPPLLGRRLVLAALGGVALLVAGQFVPSSRREYVVASAGGKVERIAASNVVPSTAHVLASTLTGQVQTTTSPAANPGPVVNNTDLLSLFDGNIRLDLREVPVIGSPDAPYVMVSLFDYTCHHCRVMHGHLMEARQKFSNQLAIVSLPVPLSEKCNRNIKIAPKVHAQACDYARLGLALWRASRKAQSRFDDWVFAPDTPPPLEQARQYASQLGGLLAVEAALKDPWIDQQIQRDVAIYETNALRGILDMPQLIIGTNVVSRTFSKVDDLYPLLSNNFGLKSDR